MKKNLLLFSANKEIAPLLEPLIEATGLSFTSVKSLDESLTVLAKLHVALVVFDLTNFEEIWESIIAKQKELFPLCKFILLHPYQSTTMLPRALAAGISGILSYPLQAGVAMETILNVASQMEREQQWISKENLHGTSILGDSSGSLELLIDLGKKITKGLDLDSALTAIVDAAVNLTHAEEGSILLKDEKTKELFMVASRNFREEYARTFRLPANDSLAGSVITSGEPILIDASAPKKIKTRYLVRSLIYVPLKIRKTTVGVLGVDNRLETGNIFTEREVKLLGMLAEFAVIAIGNARTHLSTAVEKKKLDAIVSNIQDGILLFDAAGNLMLANPVARKYFNLGDDFFGKAADVFVQNPELMNLLSQESYKAGAMIEITTAEEKVLEARATPIGDVGIGISLHDVTYLKKLDQMKSDFVNNISHDLRSPLTAILGYAELAERVGELNVQQNEFLDRIRKSVREITALIDQLLDLGRLESNLDENKEKIELIQIIEDSIEKYHKRYTEKRIKLTKKFMTQLAMIIGNRIQMQEVCDNLIGNAVKYTPQGGRIEVSVMTEGGQVIFRVVDTGIGIPTTDLPRIFQKFYRASNIPSDIEGTGLGLSIVKNIVEKHFGRIWLESSVGKGTAFTVVLPAESEPNT
jgi:signal transduction histidine kinase